MRKRVLLISSWTNDEKVLGYYLSPPMGLYRIQTWLKDKHDVEVLDPNIKEPLTYLENSEPFDIIGFSPTKDNLHNDVALMRYARKLFPQAKIILGGVEATTNYQRLFNLNVADFVILGEGEKALELFIEDNPYLNLTPSTITRQYSYSTVLTSEELTRASDVDFNQMPIRKYWARNSEVTDDINSINCVNLYITNYCPHGCKFCSTTNFVREACPKGARVVTISPRGIVTMLKKIMTELPETKTIYFHDDNAIHCRHGTIEWCKLAIKEGIKVSYVAGSRIDHFDPELLDVMMSAGFRKISCGIETYSDTLLKKIRKGQLTKDIDKFLKITSEAGIAVHVNIMLCQPEATVDDVKRTAEFCLRLLQDKRNTITGEPFIKAYSGSWYFDNWDLIEYGYKTVPSIKGTKSETIRIPVRFLPRDPKVRELLKSIDEAMCHDQFFVNTLKKSYLTQQLTEKLCKLVLDII